MHLASPSLSLSLYPHKQFRIYSKNLTLLRATWKAASVMSLLEFSPKFSISITHAKIQEPLRLVY